MKQRQWKTGIVGLQKWIRKGKKFLKSINWRTRFREGSKVWKRTLKIYIWLTFGNISNTPLGMPRACTSLLGWSWQKGLVIHWDQTRDQKFRRPALLLARWCGDTAGLQKLLTVKELLKMIEKQWFELCYPAPLLPD